MNKIKSVAFLTIGRGVNAVVNLLFLPYMARALSYDDYATYGQVLLVIEIFIILAGAANNQYLYVLLSDQRKYNKRDVIRNAVLLNLLLGLCGVALLFLFIPSISSSFQNPSLILTLKVYAFSVIPILIANTFDLVLYFFNRIKHALLIQIVSNILRVCLILISVQIFSSVELIFWLLMALNFAILVLYIPKFPVKFFLGRINKKILSQFLRFGYVLGVSGIIGTLIRRTDGLMISGMLEPQNYSIYRMGAIEVPFLMLFYSSVLTVLLPNVTKLFSEGKTEELITLKRNSISGSVIVIYPFLIFLLIFAKPVIGFYLGEKYLASVPVFVFYNAILFFRINDYRDVLISASKTKWIIQLDFLVLLVNIILNYFLISLFGINGAVAASLISFILLAFILNVKTTKLLSISTFSFFNLRLILFVSVLSLSLSALSFYFFCQNKSLLMIPLILIVYLSIVYLVLLKLNTETGTFLKKIYHGLLAKNKPQY